MFQYLVSNKTIYDYINQQPMLENYLYEFWSLITDYVVPNIYPFRYYISTYGRVYDAKKNILIAISLGTNGYLRLSLALNQPYLKITKHPHRLVMLTFKPIYNSYLFEVNHKDGRKTNNFIGNLEWNTHSQNMQHAYNTGLLESRVSIGEENPNVKYTENQVRIVCECLQKNMKYKDISDILGVEHTESVSCFISDIKNRKTWTHISKDYIFLENRPNQIFTDELIHKICKYLEKGYSTKNIIYMIYIENSKSENLIEEEKEQYRRLINTIKSKNAHTRISKNYNL
jgi:hypothetical protein